MQDAIVRYIDKLLAIPPSHEWLTLVGVTGGLLLFIAVAEIVRKFQHFSAEFTRKLVHISVGVLIFFAPTLFSYSLPAIVLAVTFIVVNYAAIRLGLFKSMHDTGRKSYGTVYYPLAFLLLVVFLWYSDPVVISASMLVLALADAAAAIVGENVKHPHRYNLSGDGKTVQGSTAMFVTTFAAVLASVAFLSKGERVELLELAAVAFVASATATAWEAISSKGLDNLTIPLSVALTLFIGLHPPDMTSIGQMSVGLSLAFLMAVLSYRAKFLSGSGSVATFLLASYIFGFGGWKWTLPILAFFLLSSLLSKLGKKRKTEFSAEHEKNDVRDHEQVAANGGVAGMLMIAQSLMPEYDFYVAYLGTIAAVTADTWGTEIGLLVKGRTVSITTLKPVRPGVNGGVSVAGFAGALMGSFMIAVAGFPWLSVATVVAVVTLAGFAGGLADSLAGATIQATYWSDMRQRLTERRHEYPPGTGQSGENTLVGGVHWIDNDVVNWICALTGAIGSVGFLLLFS